MEPKHVYAPWTREQVDWLNGCQLNPHLHAWTCGNCRADLVATVRGWICPYCDYTQDWAVAMPEEATNEQH
jgi:hypothetical protein